MQTYVSAGRFGIGLVMVLILTLSGQFTARADPPSTGGDNCLGGAYCPWADDNGGWPGSGGSGGVRWVPPPAHCTPADFAAGRQQNCILYPPGSAGPPVSSLVLWREAQARLTVPSPVIVTAPPRGRRVLVHLPSWVWPARSQWTARSATATAGDVSATVTAEPSTLTLDPGDGSEPVTCAAPWDPYSQVKLDAGETADCSLTWDHSGHYRVRASLAWSASWTGSDGNGGELPGVTRTVTFPVHVVQARSELVAGP